MPTDPPLFVLAFDHRQSLVGKMLPGREARAGELLPPAKLLVYEAARRVSEEDDVLRGGRVAVLFDEQFGGGIAPVARRDGVPFAVAIERSGQAAFVLEHGDGTPSHLDALRPDFVKVLVRYNPDGDEVVNARQRADLAAVSALCRRTHRRLLFELLVPPTPEQLAAAGGDHDAFDVEQRPALTVRALAAFQDSGTRADLWKLEGFEREHDAAAVARQATGHADASAPCLVLGRGADDAKVDHWIRVAAAVEGFAGFAIGRSLWWDAVSGWLDGDLGRDDAVARIAANYRRSIGVWHEAA
jgi:5-dehydro-2-deoxygluconokinase